MDALQKYKDRILGLWRPARRHPTKDQLAALADYTAKVWAWDDRADLIRALRRGDVVVVPTALCLGPTRKDVLATIEAIHAKRAQIVTIDSGLWSDKRDDAVRLIAEAVAEITGDSKAPTHEEAVARGRMAGKRKRAGRTSEAVAGKAWRSKAHAHLSNEQCVELPEMDGWTVGTAYRHLGKRGLAKGRPRKE